MGQMSGLAPSRRCSSAVGRPPVNDIEIFFEMASGLSSSVKYVIGLRLLILGEPSSALISLWYVEDGELVCESGPDKAYGYLGTRKYYDDFELNSLHTGENGIYSITVKKPP